MISSVLLGKSPGSFLRSRTVTSKHVPLGPLLRAADCSGASKRIGMDVPQMLSRARGSWALANDHPKERSEQSTGVLSINMSSKPYLACRAPRIKANDAVCRWS